MEKCISSCETMGHLEVMVDWIDGIMKKSVFPETSHEDITAARSLLFKGVLAQKEKIYGLGDDEEIGLTAGSIHPQ